MNKMNSLLITDPDVQAAGPYKPIRLLSSIMPRCHLAFSPIRVCIDNPDIMYIHLVEPGLHEAHHNSVMSQLALFKVQVRACTGDTA